MVDMNKTWMALGRTADGRLSQQYDDGVTSFTNFAMAVADQEGNIRCPCVKCLNYYKKKPQVVRIHLLHHGIMQSYTIWDQHGESCLPPEMTDSDDDVLSRIDKLVEDRILGESSDTCQDEEVRNFDKLLLDAKRQVYPDCTEYTLLEFVIEILNLKAMNNWSNKSVDMLLQFLSKLLPKVNLVPKSTYDAKKIVRDFGLSYELIDACLNDCTLFWKEKANLDKCPKCKASRYKINTGKGKKIPHKVLRYFPVTPRLKQKYMCRKSAEHMRWHKDKRVDDGDVLRHPADSDEWKDFDNQHPDFALEPRNVKLGLAVDGFNPFGNMSTSYSMWPVILIPHNLPPWLVMKEESLMLSLLIPGEGQPGIDIDVYMRPLVDELMELWQNGVQTYDAYSGQSFQMRAVLLWTIHDWPAFGDLSGWRTKGHYSCYTCNDEPYFQSLRSKTAYTNHRCYLPKNHPERRSKAYDGKIEKRKRSLELPEEKIQDQLEKVMQLVDSVPNGIFGKDPENRKRPKYAPNWTKASVLYELPYWKNKKLRHNTDVMHVEKNFSENIFGTMLGIEGKNKDTDKARMDLEDMGIRKHLWLKRLPDGTPDKPRPRASFSLTPEHREAFFEFLKSVKYPDGYAANISRSVNARNGRLTGLKSHDCHVLLQRILPIGMRGYVDKEIDIALFELGSFFQDLCSRTLRRSELEKLEERIVHILCKLEKIFIPAFFDVMVHLAVHLPREAILGGPVQYRWMYTIERFLGALKRFVTNRARPEGSIAEAYIVKECVTFCSNYLGDGSKTVHNRPDRNEDHGERRPGLRVFTETARPIGLITRDGEIRQELRDLAHLFFLNNSPELEVYLLEHKNELQIQPEQEVAHIQQQQFPMWFKERMNILRANESPEATKELWSLANGPLSLVKEYSGCIVNGVRFHTKELDNRRKSQNSGVLTRGDQDKHNFYGHLFKVWEFEYMCNKKVILFQCEWYNTGNETGRNRTIRHETYCTSINVRSRWCQSDPFILPSQAKQVFYLNDTKWGEPWKVVQHVQQRGVFDVPELGNGEPECSFDAFQQENITNVVPIDIDASIPPGGDIDEVDTLGVRFPDVAENDEDADEEMPDVDIDVDMDYDM